jgi:DNA mismatch repair protein MutL
MVEKHKGVSQQQLFPQTLEFSAGDAVILKELHEELHALGFDINGFGKNTFIVHGIPADISDQNIFELLEKLIEDYKSSQGSKSNLVNAKKEIVAKAMAKSLSIKSGEPLNHEEMSHMVDELFACKMPYASPSGKPTLITISLDELDKKLKK